MSSSSSRRGLVPSLVLALALFGCGTPGSAPEPSEQSPAGSAGSEPVVEPSVDPTEAFPVITSDEATFEFGTIAPSEKVTHVFKLVNRGTADLTIERVEKT